MIKPQVLDAMVAAGCTAEQIAAAVKADQAASSGAERQARYRARKANARDVSDERDVTSVTSDALSSPKVFPQTPFPKPHLSNPPSPPKGGSSPAGWDEFWALYPHKVGKPDAKAKYAKALLKANPETIMDGLQRYVAKTDDRPWCNPATWLHQERWADQPAMLPRGSPAPNRPPPRPLTAAEILKHRREARQFEDDNPAPRTLDLIAAR